MFELLFNHVVLGWIDFSLLWGTLSFAVVSVIHGWFGQ